MISDIIKLFSQNYYVKYFVLFNFFSRNKLPTEKTFSNLQNFASFRSV